MKTDTLPKTISKMPKTKPAMVKDADTGIMIPTGMLITLSPSIAKTPNGASQIPAGTLISSPLSGGEDWDLGVRVVRCKMGDSIIAFAQ